MPPLIASSVTKPSCTVTDMMNFGGAKLQVFLFLFPHNLRGTMKREAGVCQPLCEKILWQLAAKNPLRKVDIEV